MEENISSDLQYGADGKEMRLNSQAQDFLKEIAKWARFLGILGLVGCGLLVLLGLLFSMIPGMAKAMNSNGGAMASAGSPIMMSVIYILMALLYYFPAMYLYKFAKNMRNALDLGGEAETTKAFEYLKSHYKFLGILMAIVLGLYALIFVVGILVATMAA
jgi:hypothetical protein